MKSKSNERLKIFIKMAGGQSKVAEKTGLSVATVSNISRPDSDPSFKVTCAIFKAYPALNPKWWFFGGDEPMWIDKPVDMDVGLTDTYLLSEDINTYQINKDYSKFDKAELISMLIEKDVILNRLLIKENRTNNLLNEQLDVLKNILQTIENQRETSKDTK